MKNLLLLFILGILIGWALFTIAHDYDHRMDDYNRYMCATYGYKPDCKTVLPESERLQ